MQIIITMAGIGNRFREAGYKESKYLLKIQGKTIIEKIISNFNKKNDFFLFISNKKDYENNNLNILFDSIDINYKLISIENHKLGPVMTLKKAEQYIDLEKPIIVNYCDFYWSWDYNHFKKEIQKYDGAIICYKGFHPHLIHSNLYAGVKVNKKNELNEIREKYSYTKNKMNTLQSSGTYYFKNGKILLKYINELIKKNIKCNDEFYVSLLYNLLKKDGLNTLIYEIPYFIQLGTPDDYQEYKYFESIFNPTNQQTLFIP